MINVYLRSLNLNKTIIIFYFICSSQLEFSSHILVNITTPMSGLWSNVKCCILLCVQLSVGPLEKTLHYVCIYSYAMKSAEFLWDFAWECVFLPTFMVKNIQFRYSFVDFSISLIWLILDNVILGLCSLFYIGRKSLCKVST